MPSKSLIESKPPRVLQVLAYLCRRVHLWSGLARVTNLQILRKACVGVNGDVEAVLLNGIKMPVRLSDFNGRMLFLFGQTDPKVIRVCQSLLRAGDVFLDIGANHGEVGLLCACEGANSVEIHLFEPIPLLAQKIGEVIERHSLERVYVHACGLGRDNERKLLEINPSHTGKARIVPPSTASESSIEIQMRRVNDLLGEVAQSRSVVAKVDVEGAEGDIVPSLLDWPGTRAVVFEWEHLPDHAGFRGLVHDHGFSMYGLEKRAYRPRLIPADAVDAAVSDVVAVRSSLFPNDLAWHRIDSLARGSSV